MVKTPSLNEQKRETPALPGKRNSRSNDGPQAKKS